MSRHEVAGRKPGSLVVVGWDHPLLTYFVHVYAPGDIPGECDGPKVWLGGTPRELYDVDDLKRAVRPHADLSPELLARLYGDRDEGWME